ncbi:MAG: T9SS type A sorting domain-containing protein [Candidatus Kapaibacterium sp.]
MKKFLCTILFLFLVSSINYTYSAGTHPSRFRNLNFEGGGWVTEIIPAQYKNVSYPSLNQYILYARTDVGGLYRSSNNGENWTNITNYYWDIVQTGISLSPSEMSIQGLAIHPENPNIIVVACGNSMEDASNYAIPYQNIRKSTNGGVNWIPLNTGFMDFTGIVFKGNNNVNEGYEKLGGECIIFSPNKEGNIYPMYAGGAPAGSCYSWLYKSTDEGLTWRRVPNYPENTHTITSIAMKEGSSHIWVGTSGGVYVSTNNGYTWSSLYCGTVFHHVKRIVLWGNDANRIAYATYGTLNSSNQSQYGIARISYNGNFAFDELTGGFDAGASNEQKTTHFSPIIFPRKTTDGTIDETHLIAGRYGRPIRESHGTIPGNTGSWGGHYQQSGSNTQIIFKFEESGHNLPGHQLSSTIEPFPYTGLNNITQNPHYPSCWYASGGAGAFKSENVTIDNSGYTSFATSRWKYIVSGISMPVVHDISFIRNSAGTQMAAFPIMDWVIGWSTNWGHSFSPLHYDRRQIYANWQNTYMTDASRCLENPGVQGISYVIGGNADNGKAMIYERSQIGTDVTITRTDNISPVPEIYTDNNRFITDGIMFTTVDYVGPGNNIILGGANRILMLVGQNAGKIVPNSNTLGLFYSDNGGRSVTQSTFTEPSTIMGISTNDRYSQSLLPSAFNNVLGDRSVSQFNLTYDNINHIIYLYFENGGVFKSTNNGSSFSFAGYPTIQQVDYLNEGSIKYNNGKLYLAIKGNPSYAPNYRKGGLFVSSNGGANWLPTGGDFVDATHLEVVKTRIAVFGRRKINNTEEKFRSLYMSTNSGLNWKKLPGNENQTISATIPYIRSLRARPFPYDNELWVATSGQGVVVYSGFTSATPMIVLDNITINNEYHCNENIEIESGGCLTIEGNIGFYAAKDKKIIVREGGKLIVQGVTFNSLDSSQQWGGIEVENCDSSLTIQNCTFNNATLPIKIVNDESAYKEMIIKNNVFNCESNQDFAIYAENVFNILIQGNHFNMAGENSSTVGLEVKNNGDYSCDDFTPRINIINNTFTNGFGSMVLNSYASELTPVYVYGNTFNGSSANYNIIGRMITGTIKNNRFWGTDTDNPIYLQQCTPDMFGNLINGSGTTMILNGHSYPNLSPLRTSNTYYWYGGQNRLSSSNAGNINIIDAGLPSINYGHNQFSKNSDPLYFHIAGALDLTVETYSAAENAWCSSGSNPVNYLYTSENPYVITDISDSYTCNQLPAIQYTGSVVKNMGFGINDTIFTSSYSTNYYIIPDELLYSQASIYISGGQYLDAINGFKNLINTHIESQYLNTSLYEIFDCYQGLDTSSSPTYRDNLYSDLKTFLNDKIQSEYYNSEFIDIAYYLVNMCEVNMEKYNDALTGFEFIAMFHPNAAMRLLASWDYDEVQDLMGQSGAEKEITAEQFREKVLAEIEIALQKDSTMRVVSGMFKQQNEEIDNTYANKTKSSNSVNTGKNNKDNASKKDNTSKGNSKRPNIMQLSKEVRADLMQRAEDNLRGLRAMNTDKKIKKHKEDILLIAGLTAATEKKIETTSLPLSYSLSQNYPNPFNPVTKINFELPGDGKVKLMIYDVLGREIKTLVNEVKQAGKYTVEFNGSNFASGVYFYRIESGKFTDVKRMVLVK